MADHGHPIAHTGPPADTPATSRGRWAALLALVFLCVAAVGIAHHELWRDEWQAWLLARDSGSLTELLRNLRHEAHPPTWNLLLFLLSRVTRDPLAMQGLHLLIAAASVYILGRFAPLSRAWTGLIAFGYFLAYEYAVIARPYALGVLALFTFCALFPRRHRHPVAVFLSLLALAGTTAYGLIISIAAGGALVVEAAVARIQGGGTTWWRRRRAWLGVAAWIAGMMIVAVAIRPPRGIGSILSFEQALSRWSIASTLAELPRSYLPLADPSAEHTWNSWLLPGGSRGALALTTALAVVLGVGSVLLFLRKPAALFLYLAGSAGVLAFHHLVFRGMMRHSGHLFLVWLAALWLAALPTRAWRLPPWLDRWAGLRRPAAVTFIAAVLVAQVAAAALLYVAEVRRPFSAAPEAAAFLRADDLERLPIGASTATVASSVAGHLDRPLYYLALQEPGTFVRWERYPRRRDRNLSMRFIRPFLDGHESDVLLLLETPFDDWDPDLTVEELARFPPGLEHREGYVIYRVARPGS